MNYRDLINHMTPDMCERLQHAVATGRWPDGSRVADEQKDQMIQALIAYQALHQAQRDEPFTVNENGELRQLKPADDARRNKRHQHDDAVDEFKLDLK